MIYLLIAAFYAIVQGLSLMVIWRTLNLTTPSPKEVISKLMPMGIIITVLGIVILAIGVVFPILDRNSQGTAVILSTGANVAALGIASMIRACGHTSTTKVLAGAWALTGIGIGLILAYSVVVCVLKCSC